MGRFVLIDNLLNSSIFFYFFFVMSPALLIVLLAIDFLSHPHEQIFSFSPLLAPELFQMLFQKSNVSSMLLIAPTLIFLMFFIWSKR